MLGKWGSRGCAPISWACVSWALRLGSQRCMRAGAPFSVSREAAGNDQKLFHHRDRAHEQGAGGLRGQSLALPASSVFASMRRHLKKKKTFPQVITCLAVFWNGALCVCARLGCVCISGPPYASVPPLGLNEHGQFSCRRETAHTTLCIPSHTGQSNISGGLR